MVVMCLSMSEGVNMSNLHRVHETFLARVLQKTFISFHVHVETAGVKCQHIVSF